MVHLNGVNYNIAGLVVAALFQSFKNNAGQDQIQVNTSSFSVFVLSQGG